MKHVQEIGGYVPHLTQGLWINLQLTYVLVVSWIHILCPWLFAFYADTKFLDMAVRLLHQRGYHVHQRSNTHE